MSFFVLSFLILPLGMQSRCRRLFPPVLKCANFLFGCWFWENVVVVSALAKVWFFDLDLAVQVEAAGFVVGIFD